MSAPELRHEGTGRAPVPSWALLSSALAPVLLIGGWTIAAAVQPDGFDSTVETISQLAAAGTPHRWLMTAGLAGLGACHVVTAYGLRPAAGRRRAVLAVGGVATMAVAALPLAADGSGSPSHAIAAGTGFAALALWPALACRRGVRVPRLLRPVPSWAASAALLGLVGWFGVELGAGDRVGLAERCVAGAEALWPLVVVLGARARERGAAEEVCPRTR